MKVGRDVSARRESCGKKNRAGKRPEAREKKKKRGCWAGETKRHFFFFRFSSSSGALFALSLHGALSLFYAIEHEMGASSHLEMKKERGSKRGAERRKSRAFFFFEGREKKMKRRKKKKASYFLFLPLRRRTFPLNSKAPNPAERLWKMARLSRRATATSLVLLPLALFASAAAAVAGAAAAGAASAPSKASQLPKMTTEPQRGATPPSANAASPAPAHEVHQIGSKHKWPG